jgi:hypothetical protein
VYASLINLGILCPIDSAGASGVLIYKYFPMEPPEDFLLLPNSEMLSRIMASMRSYSESGRVIR